MQEFVNKEKIIKDEKNIFTKVVFVTLFIAFALFTKIFIELNANKTSTEITVIFTETFSLILSILAFESFIISYKRLKKDSIFIISLLYLSISVSILLRYLNYITFYYEKFSFSNFITLVTCLLRSFLLIIAILPKSKIREFLANNKMKSIFFIIAFLIVIKILDFNLSSDNNIQIYVFSNGLLTIICFIASLILIINGIKEKEYFYTVLSASIFTLGLKCIYSIYNLFSSTFNSMITAAAISYVISLIIIVGSFIELFLYINKTKMLNENLNTFFEIADNNKHSYMFICDKHNNVIYSNKKLREYREAMKDNDPSTKVLNFCNIIDNADLNDISKSIDKDGFWRGIIKSKSEETCIDCCIQVLDEDKKTAVTYMDISHVINNELELEKLKVYKREKVDFISNISHELRTPINIFYSTVQLLDKIASNDNLNLKDVYNRHRGTLHINCKRMLKLVNNIIDISRIEIGTLKANYECYNLVSIIEDVTLSVNNYAVLKSINVHFDTNCEEFITKCDSSMIERVLLNLLSNAIKFSSDYKNIYVNVFVYNSWIEIYVKDEGKGISPRDKKHIFERFVQADKSITRQNEGSGIGLSIVKSIIALHDGHISVESTLGVGSTFKILLPQRGSNPQDCMIYDINSHSTELELSDIYEVCP